MNNKLYVNYTNTNLQNKKHASKLEVTIVSYFKKDFDIVSILDIDKIDLAKYDVVIVNSLCLSPTHTHLHPNIINQKSVHLKKIKNVIVLLHDLHDYSMGYTGMKTITKMDKGKKIRYLGPILEDTPAKKMYQQLFDKIGAKYLISLCDCPEYSFFKNYLKNINIFYLVNHGFSNQIFKPITCTKKYDVLFYGSFLESVYPFRNRIYNICRKMKIKLKRIDSSAKINEKKLCSLINQSWLCISCVSNFSYFVRKYLEISACNSLVVGNINNQGYHIIGNNMVLVNDTLSDAQIRNKIKYYLQNKEIISALSYNKLNRIALETYTYFSKKIAGIATNVINNQTIEINNKPIEINDKPITSNEQTIVINNPRRVISNQTSVYEYNKNYEPFVFNNIIHNKKLLKIKFKASNINGKKVLVCDNIFNIGLYVLVFSTNKYNLISISDKNGKELVRKDTIHMENIKNIFHVYVPFNIATSCHINLSNNIPSDFKIFQIN